MAGERWTPYRKFYPGQTLKFSSEALNPDGSLRVQKREVEIARVAGGGFFGHVLIPEEGDFVIKTSTPDPWHEFWRRVNWDFKNFPSQVSLTQAQMDFLIGRIIHDTLPIISNGWYVAPDSLGYTRLSRGYDQLIEKMDGRIPRFDNNHDEFYRFRRSQHLLTNLALDLGLEQAGQVHPDNLFAMANLWHNPNSGQDEWMDLLPAIRHTEWVWPIPLKFKFHHQLRCLFYPSSHRVTFNRIHTDRFWYTIWQNRDKFPDELLSTIKANLTLYETLRQQEDQHTYQPDKTAALWTLLLAGTDAMPKVVMAPAKIAKKTIAPFRIIVDSNYRKEKVLEGAREAHQHKLITDEQLEQCKQSLEFNHHTPDESRRQALAYLSISGVYAGLSFLSKFPEAAAYLMIVQSRPEGWLGVPVAGVESALTFLAFRFLPGIPRSAITRGIGRILGVDLRVASYIALLPSVFSLLAIPGQMTADTGSKDRTLWHYAIRKIISDLSSILPHGGPGTQLEGELWERFGKRIEKLVKE